MRTLYEKQLHEIAARDSLTGAYTRREFMSQGEGAFSEIGQGYSHISVLMLDIDHFKSINDKYGHSMGDKNLQMFVKTVNSCLRTNDIVGRLGGEEFAVILIDSDITQALTIAERIRAQIEKLSSTKRGGIEPMTVSIGVEQAENNVSLEDLLKKADELLYKAKSSGRNQVVRRDGF